MGTSGIGIKDNDMALDFAIKVIRYGFKVATLNEDFLLLVDMCIRYDYVLNEKERLIIENVISEEIQNIPYWKEYCREDRLKLLEDISQKVEIMCS